MSVLKLYLASSFMSVIDKSLKFGTKIGHKHFCTLRV